MNQRQTFQSSLLTIIRRTIIIRLISTAQTGYFYTTQRVRTGPKLSAVKYDPIGLATRCPLQYHRTHLFSPRQQNPEYFSWRVGRQENDIFTLHSRVASIRYAHFLANLRILHLT